MNLKICRIEKDISQKELADKLLVTVTTISRWETGRNEPDLKTLIKLANILEVSTDKLLGINK